MALFDGYEASEVRYDGGVLEPPEDGSCLLPGLGGNLVVAPHCDPSRVTRFDLTPPLIFKTKKHYKGPGRQVRRLTQGCFIVIVPADWKWTGPQPQVEPAFTSIEGYQAHFVHGTTSDDDIGGFDKTGSLPRAMDRYLIGTTVHDDDEYGGPLFVGQYPELVNVDDFEWAIVGEEGESPGWRTRFKLSKRTLGEVLEERESGPGQHRGWLFLRLHDATPSLVASSCFRYFPEHLQVCVDDQPYTPSPRLPDDAGHRQARLTFTATPSTTIRLTVRSGHVLDDHAVLIPEHRDDEVSVVLSTETHSVSVLVSLPRVWWRLLNQSRTDDSQEGKNDWAARPLRLTRQRFETLALAGTILQLHAPHTRQVMCGFDFAEKDSAVRTYRSTTAPTIDILLDDFLDDAALDDDPRRHASLDMSSNQWPHNVSAIHVLPEIAAGEIVATDADTPSDGAEPVLPLPATPESVLPVEGTQRYDCGEYLVRHEPSHTWEVARRQGFVSIPNQRHLPGPGSRIWVCVARGYVGVGRVLGTSERVQQPKASSNQESASHQVLKVRWLDTRHASRAVPFGETLAMPWDALAVPSAGGNLAAPWFRWTVGRLKLNFHGWNTEVKDDA